MEPLVADKLPTKFEVAVAIFSLATKPGSAKMNTTINNYGKALVEVWQKAFTKNHVITLTGVKYHITRLVKDYFTSVYKKSGKSSLRSLQRSWQAKGNDTLFDIGRDTENLQGNEKHFYEDQKYGRDKWRLDKSVDVEYENEQQAIQEAEIEQMLRDKKEEDFIMASLETEANIQEDEDGFNAMNSTMNSDSLSLNTSCSRSGFVRLKTTGVSVGIQTDPVQVERKRLRIVKRVSTEEIKSACATVSSICGVSAEMARKIVQIIARELYGHTYYLTPEDQVAGEELNSDAVAMEDGGKKHKDYSYVICSARTISDHKQVLASEMETLAAEMLLEKDDATKSTIHFDTTSRNNIDGEWPSLILRFSDNTEYRLRPIFFAYEDREQITRLFQETFLRLAGALSIRKGVAIEASTLWEKVDSLMTDAVTKNLGIEDTIPAALGSQHKPLHLLCKSHTVEALDRANLEVLSKIEKNVNQQGTLESINPGLKSFFRGKTALVEAGITALLSLVTHNKSANSCSQADLFEHICERENTTKRIFLYQQRRFAKLGKSAASILQARDILEKVLDEVQLTNQLVESCRIFLSSDLFITELECLAFFNYHVTFPFLNCVERSSQDDLLQILPKLYDELCEGKTNTLSDFVVKMHGIPVPQLSSEVSKKIVKLMCTSAAEAVKLQCGREYGFSDLPGRATDLSKLSTRERTGLPTNNCINERDLSRFDKEALVSRCRNRKFKAKNIRNNMVLYKCKKAIKVDRVSKQINLVLSERERQWNTEQSSLFNIRLEEKLQKVKKQKDYVRRLLRDCKSWSGPATSAEELRTILFGKDNQQHVLRTEMSYYAHTHRADKIANKELFRINSITYEEMLENLMILLDDEKHESTATIANLPSNDDVLKSLLPSHSTPPTTSVDDRTNKMCVVIWNINDNYEWYLGYVVKHVDDKLSVDNLARSVKNSHSKWKYPSKEDIQLVDMDQVVDCEIIGEWDMTADSRKRFYTLSNAKDIAYSVKQYIA